jgi:Flp pilus assembly pilin Flp
VIKIPFRKVLPTFNYLHSFSGRPGRLRKRPRLVPTAATIRGVYRGIPNGIGAVKKPDRCVTEAVEYVKRSTLERNTTMFMNFIKDESGAVTVDWVVLTAAVVGLGLVVFSAIKPKVSALATSIGTEIDNAGTKMTTP